MAEESPAALRACFSDFRLIKGRKQAQLVLEIPIEEADNALAVLGGIPQPQSDCWVAVARLNGVAKPEPEPKEKRKWDDLKLSMQAGIRCEEPAFWRFINESYSGYRPITDQEAAATFVRRECQVDSRSGLNTSRHSAMVWQDLEKSYQAWLKAAE
jgi:hypothetical protein